MRTLQRDKRSVTFRSRTTVTRPDATTVEAWVEHAQELRGNVQPAGGKLMAELYGERVSYMLVMYVEGRVLLEEASGAWVDVLPSNPLPDYKVVAIRQWRHTVIEMEKVR